MNEQTMIWFLQKTTRHALSKEAVSLWMDFYTYLQNQNRACNPQIPFAALQQICELDSDAFQAACQELNNADMLQFVFENGQLLCKLTARRLYRAPEIVAG